MKTALVFICIFIVASVAAVDPCSELEAGGTVALSGTKVYEDCSFTGLSVTVTWAGSLDLTLRRVTWNGGSLQLGSTTDLKVLLDACTMTNMGDVLVMRTSDAISDVELSVVDTVIDSMYGSVVSFRGDFNGVRRLRFDSSSSALYSARRDVVAIISEAVENVAFTYISMSVRKSIARAGGRVAIGCVLAGGGGGGAALIASNISLVAISADVDAAEGNGGFVVAMGLGSLGRLLLLDSVISVSAKSVVVATTSPSSVASAAAALFARDDLKTANVSVAVTQSLVTVGTRL